MVPHDVGGLAEAMGGREEAAARLDGAAHERSWLPGSFLDEGDRLSFTLPESPDTDWATAPEGLPVDH